MPDIHARAGEQLSQQIQMYPLLHGILSDVGPMASLGSLCTRYMLMIQHCYTGECTKRKTNGTLQFSVIACSIILIPEVVL